MSEKEDLKGAPLGKAVEYVGTYAPELLFPVARVGKRAELGITGRLPFSGCDIWNAYEVSWLQPGGKPEVAIAEMWVPCDSGSIVESKSLKLYLNSLNQTRFKNVDAVREVIRQDVSQAAGVEVEVRMLSPERFEELRFGVFPGTCIDGLEVETDRYTVAPEFLEAEGSVVEEALFSNLLRSNCPETDQPDWGSVWVHYAGPRIDAKGLLKYVISFREHHEFHEHCVERIFMDLMRRCKPEKLTVYARYTRRGGLDINPFRSNWEGVPENVRMGRQ
ncbi:MAG: NADPH-dependent 7-cyano-7-deazaguanine reductase QueF [bacterium]|nr:NADPH-dependent 7-cyano-7-deazaguanine reductase QueF [bacterium]